MKWRRWSDLSRVERVGLYTRQSLYIVLWTFNGLELLSPAAKHDDGAALLGGGLVVTAAGFATMRDYFATRRLRWSRVAPLLAFGGAFYVIALASWDGTARGAAVTVVAASVALPLGLVPDNRLSLAVVLLAGALFGISGGELVNVGAGLLFGVALIVTARASMWLFGIVTELDAARQANAQLAVLEERLRFSHDVHDVLGRRLSAIAVQAELAATLSERGDDRAAERMLEVRGLAHEALREARQLARGYRSTDFAKELEGARSLLRSAGIEVDVRVEEMPRAWHEAAGWVVREGVTNVLRHSSAELVEISYADGRLTLGNDGVRSDDSGDGSGLRGLLERLEPLGASLCAQRGEDGRWVVVAQLPGSGPISARAR